jgi:2-dehydro-3-deoxygluconokinase
MLKLREKEDCRWDLVSLGEILLRFCPQEKRIQTADSFDVFDGGAEYNVARNLSACFHQKTAVISSLADNQLGRMAERLARTGGVDVSEIIWRNADDFRNGLYFIERGFGNRPPSSCFDRSATAISNLEASAFDWHKISAQTRWFHTGGVFAGLSETTAETVVKALQLAREGGAVISYDLNYRDSLWRKKGGRAAANILNREALKYADVVFGLFDFDAGLSVFDESDFTDAARKMAAEFPNLQIIATTLRDVKTATRHDLSSAIWSRESIAKARNYINCEIYDRVGSGDAFSSGVIYGLLQGASIQFSIDCGTASGVLAMTTGGDNLQVSKTEIENLINDTGAAARR